MPSVVELIRGEEQRRVNNARLGPVAGVTQAPVGLLTGPQGFMGSLYKPLPFQAGGSTGGQKIRNKMDPGTFDSQGGIQQAGGITEDVMEKADPMAWLKQGKSQDVYGNRLRTPPKPMIKGIPGRVYGGGVEQGKPYVVGENGPEYFVPHQSGTIIPNHMTTADDFYKARDPGAINNLSDLQMSQFQRSAPYADFNRAMFLRNLAAQKPIDASGGSLGFAGSIGGGAPMPYFNSSPNPSQLTEQEIAAANALYQGIRDPYKGTHSWDDIASQQAKDGSRQAFLQKRNAVDLERNSDPLPTALPPWFGGMSPYGMARISTPQEGLRSGMNLGAMSGHRPISIDEALQRLTNAHGPSGPFIQDDSGEWSGGHVPEPGYQGIPYSGPRFPSALVPTHKLRKVH